MGQNDRDSVEPRRFDLEEFPYVLPFDPYNARVIQLKALKQMGYPVDQQEFNRDELPEDFINSGEMAWACANYQTWLWPITKDPDFKKYLEDPDLLGEHIRSHDKNLDRRLIEHPMKLISQIDMMFVDMLAYEIDCFEMNKPCFLSDNGAGLLTGDLLRGCFMAALERYNEHFARDYFKPGDGDLLTVTTEDFIRYRMYAAQGLRAVSTTQLQSLAVDYYTLAEKARVELVGFRI